MELLLRAGFYLIHQKARVDGTSQSRARKKSLDLEQEHGASLLCSKQDGAEKTNTPLYTPLHNRNYVCRPGANKSCGSFGK